MISGESLSTKIDLFARKNLLFVGGQADHCCSCTGNEISYCCECKSGSLDSTCSAELMGRCRLMRLHVYYQYLNVYFGGVGSGNRKIVDVPGIAHSGCVIQDENVRNLMFSLNEGDENTTEETVTT